MLHARQVFNYSKLGTHDEVARAMVTIPSKYRQGDRPWEQRVAMQPVARAGKGALWGGEVFLRLRYAAPQVLHICNVQVAYAIHEADVFSTLPYMSRGP